MKHWEELLPFLTEVLAWIFSQIFLRLSILWFSTRTLVRSVKTEITGSWNLQIGKLSLNKWIAMLLSEVKWKGSKGYFIGRYLEAPCLPCAFPCFVVSSDLGLSLAVPVLQVAARCWPVLAGHLLSPSQWLCSLESLWFLTVPLDLHVLCKTGHSTPEHPNTMYCRDVLSSPS